MLQRSTLTAAYAPGRQGCRDADQPTVAVMQSLVRQPDHQSLERSDRHTSTRDATDGQQRKSTKSFAKRASASITDRRCEYQGHRLHIETVSRGWTYHWTSRLPCCRPSLMERPASRRHLSTISAHLQKTTKTASVSTFIYGLVKLLLCVVLACYLGHLKNFLID